ncbi:metacaspase-1-like [Malania oleifera]|uniref:metacaspase-1-like n=1 Tax=Malania oleifera TaxID=397392 RepID=UPI0025AE96ED|nr:metacaspase-1-like [Malania oleifera]
MAGRIERCSWCGVQLLVPADAQAIQCAVCQAVTQRVRPTGSPLGNPLGQAHGTLSQATGWFKGIFNTVANNISVSNGTSGGGSSGYYAGYGPQLAPRLPPRLPPMMPPLSAHGRKRALLCGVSYHDQKERLKGSVNDVRCMKYFLVEKLGFPIDSILVLTEEETDPLRIPTKRNIRTALRWLIQGCQSGDSLVFHFSGHGSRQQDDNGDEMDGYDETLCPVDYETQGTIVDDEINATIVRPLPKGAKLHAIVDACYSGTVLDLPFVCRMNKEGYYFWEDHSRPSTYKGTDGGLALCFSACDDHQTSADTKALSGSVTTGVLTYSFIQAVQNEPGLAYGRLLSAMRSAIREARTGLRLNGPIASLINKALGLELSQEPQLSSSEKFDIYAKPFIL